MTRTVLAFLLSGQVQGVKMRRYVESAARHFGLAGYVINMVETGDVLGEAWVVATDTVASMTRTDEPEQKEYPVPTPLEQFHQWIRGQWEPREYHNLKPTPIGTAYPANARVSRCATLLLQTTASTTDEKHLQKWRKQFATFTMIREDAEADQIASERIPVYHRLRFNNDDSKDGMDVVATCAWPEPSSSMS